MKMTITFECDLSEGTVSLSPATKEWMGSVALADALLDISGVLPVHYEAAVRAMSDKFNAAKPPQEPAA